VTPQNLLAEEWDYLVVLDACRNDVFQRTYGDYVSGAVETRESPGSATPEWAMRTFTGHHDLTYFSANPLINSLAIPFNEIPWGKSLGDEYAWAAGDHIAEVVDLWKTEWDDDLGTVHPRAVTDAVLDSPDLLARRDRTVVHYLQPHMPYIDGGKGRKMGELRNAVSAAEGDSVGALTKFGDYMTPRVRRWFEGSTLLNRLGVVLDLDVEHVVSALTSGRARSVVEEYYERTLRIAMAEVERLVAELDGDVVVTADHGEAFGEAGVWEHHVETHIPCLVNVPWVRVGA
jgi:hypothetical protein